MMSKRTWSSSCSLRTAVSWILCFSAGLMISTSAQAADVPATPADYQAKVKTLKPGDTLKLAAGDYLSGMNLVGMNGTAAQPIVIEGPATGTPAQFLGVSGKNTIDIQDSSYIVIRNLVLDGKKTPDGDAIKAGGKAGNWAHHITIEGCIITNHDVNQTSQQMVGISTKIVAWDWVIRGNVIDGAGTGLYLGNSDGTRAFIGGIIENNLIKKTLGYNMQIKHQLHRQQADVPNVPTDPRVTIIRNNVFIKQDIPSPDGARPNLLVDGFPNSGPGSSDHYEIYGNFFYHNKDESLFQGSGRIHLHDNLMVDSNASAIRIQAHSGKGIIDAWIYDNTIYDTATGISFGSAPSGSKLIAGNAIFSPKPINGVTGEIDNIFGSVADAATYVISPSKTLGKMNFFPKVGSKLKGSKIDLSSAKSDLDYDLDFNGTPRDFTYRGAYQGEGKNPGWTPDATMKDTGENTGGAGGAGGAGGNPQGGAGQGGSTQGGQGGNAQGGNAQGGNAQGGSAQGGEGGNAQGGETSAGGSTTAGAGGQEQGGGGSTTAGAGGDAQGGNLQGGSSSAGKGGSTTAGAGGSVTAGKGGSGGQPSSGGSSSAGSSGHLSAGTGGTESVGGAESEEEGGCGCRTAPSPSKSSGFTALVGVLFFSLRRRIRKHRPIKLSSYSTNKRALFAERSA